MKFDNEILLGYVLANKLKLNIGDTIRLAGIKINSNFDEVYEFDPVKSDIRFDGNNIRVQSSNADLALSPSGTGTILFGDGIRINDNNIETVRSNDNIIIVPSGSGQVVIDGVGFNSGTTITALDSSAININESFRIDGNFYICSKKFLMKHKKFSVENKTKLIESDVKYPIDIDNDYDFKIAKSLIEND